MQIFPNAMLDRSFENKATDSLVNKQLNELHQRYTASCTCRSPNPRKERTRQQEEPDDEHKRRCQRRHPERLQRCRHCREYHGRQHHSKRCVCRRGGVQDKKAATKRNGGKNRVEAKGTGANRGLGSTHTPRYEQSDE